MRRNNQTHDISSKAVRARLTDMLRKSPLMADLAGPSGPTGIELDDEAIEKALSTSLPEIEADIAQELGDSAPLVMMIALAAAAGLGPEPLALRVSSPNEFELQQLVWASYRFFGDVTIGGKLLAEKPVGNAPLQVELLRGERRPSFISRSESTSRLFVQVSDDMPRPESGVYEMRLGLNKQRAVRLQQWCLDQEAIAAKQCGQQKMMPKNVMKGLIKVGWIEHYPLLAGVLDNYLLDAGYNNDLGFGTLDQIRRFMIAAFCMTGNQSVERFLLGDMDTIEDVFSLLSRVRELAE